jgi:hypothetical protein
MLSVAISLCLFFGSLQAAAGKHEAACSSADAAKLMPLIPCAEPLPFDANLSDIELLMRPQQFKSDIAQMAVVVELFDYIEAERKEKKLCMLPLFMRCMVSHASIGKQLKGCSSNLREFFNKRSNSAAEHPEHDVHEAVADLFIRSKLLWDATPAEEREAWLLHECALYKCPATRTRYPDVRAKFEQTFVEAMQAKAGNKSVFATFGPDSFGLDLRLLQKLSESGINNVETVVAIDTDFSSLMYQLTKGNEHGAIEIPFDEQLQTKIQYADLCHGSFHYDYNTTMQKTTNGDPAAFSQQLGILIGLQASDSAFAKTLHPYVVARVIDQFKKAALQVQPSLKRMYVSASVAQYLQDCTTRPELRADMLNGCDFVHLRSAASTPTWRKCWDDFYAAQGSCLAPSAISCALMTMASNQALMQVYHEADKKVEQWEFLEGNWRELSEGEINHNHARDWLFALTHPVVAPKPAISTQQLQPTQVAKPKVTKPAPRTQQKKKRTVRKKGRRR